MQLSEITDKVNKLASAWEHFKSVNDQRLKAIEKKGSNDPLIDEQLRKVTESLDYYKSRLGEIEIAVSRPVGEIDLRHESYEPSEYKNALRNYLCKGIEKDLAELEKKSLSVGSNPDGGYLVTSQMSKTMIKDLQERSSMRKLASVETISSDALDIIEDMHEAYAGWTSETGPINDTATPTIGKKKIPVHELYAQPRATQKLVDDANIDIEKWLVGKLVDIFAIKENSAFITGDGIGKPKGILSYEAGKDAGKIEQINSGVNGGITADSVFNLFFALKDSFASRATFLMHRSVIQAVRMLKDKSSGHYLWSPGLALGTPSTLLGAPVMECSDMPVAATGSLSMVFADFANAYKIVDRMGIRVLRDPFTDKPFIKFYTTKRVGGDVTNCRAIKIMKFAA